MGITAYYVHVDAGQLKSLREKPALVWNIRNDSRFAKAGILSVDKDWQVLSWLASSKKRKEQQQSVAMMNVMSRKNSDELMNDDAKYEKALSQERAELGITAEDTNALPTDPILTAIEGRGIEKQRDPKLNFGLGGARVFPPEEVKILAVSFSKFKESELRANFDRKVMAKFDVGGIGWLEERDSVLDEFLIPNFRQLSKFYQYAAKMNHYVLVIYQ